MQQHSWKLRLNIMHWAATWTSIQGETKQPTWLFEGSEDGQSAGVLGICELHHTVVISLVEAKHSAGIICFCKGGAEK